MSFWKTCFLKTTSSEVENESKSLNLPAAFTRKKVPSDLDAVATKEETESSQTMRYLKKIKLKLGC